MAEDGSRLFVVYITGDRQPADRADVRWDQKRLTLTLSRMREHDASKLAAVYHCVELPLSTDASGRILIDGATGERASSKHSSYLDPDRLNGDQTLDSLFEPSELLEPREIVA